MNEVSQQLPFHEIQNPLKSFYDFFSGGEENAWVLRSGNFLGNAHPLLLTPRQTIEVIQGMLADELIFANRRASSEVFLLRKLFEISSLCKDEKIVVGNQVYGLLTRIGKVFDKKNSFFASFLEKFTELVFKEKLANPNVIKDKLHEFTRATITKEEVDSVGKDVEELLRLSQIIKMEGELRKELDAQGKIKIDLKKQTSELGVSENWHQHFDARAKEVRREERVFNKKFGVWFLNFDKIGWLRFFIYIIPVLSAVVAARLVMCDEMKNFGFGHIELALSAVVLVSFLSYHLKQSLNELKVLKNMRSSYLHRSIVAKTFQSLVVSDHFKDTKGEIVVKEAAMAMFKKENHGYLSKDQMEPSNTPIQEVIGIFNKGNP